MEQTAQLGIMELAETGQADALREQLLAKCNTPGGAGLYYFSKVIMGYKDMTDDLHYEMCCMAQSGNLKEGYLVPRGHLKSTILTKACSLYDIIQNPEERILIVGESDTVGAKNLRDIKWHLENNQILRWLYPHVIPPDFNNTKWTDTEILLPRKGTYDESTITTCGIGAKLTGFHFTKIYYDDPYGEKASQSTAEAERVREWVQYAPGLLVNPETSVERWTGTRWKHGDGDIYGWVMANMPYVVWYRRSAIENGVPIWPERFTINRLKEIESREGKYKYACQYMNDPTPPEGSDFLPEWIKYYHVREDDTGRMTIVVPEDNSPEVFVGNLYRSSFYDPSSGGASATAENAVNVLGTAADGRHFVLDNWARNCGYPDAIEKWHQLKDQFITRDDTFEEVGAQRSVGDIVRMRRMMPICVACKKTHRLMNPKPWRPPGGGRLNKEDRIRLYLQDPMQRGLLYLRRGQEALRNQIVSFPHLTLFDRIDALASNVHLSRRPLSDEEKADEKEKKAAFEAHSKSRIATKYDHGGYR